MIKNYESNGRFSRLVTAGGFAFLSGVTARNRDAGIAAQTENVLAQIDAYLEKAASHKDKMVSVNIWLKDIADIGAMNEVWMAWITPGHEPARATVESRLATPDLLVEIMVQAMI